MLNPVRILLVEDSKDDVELLRIHLASSGLLFHLEQVDDLVDFLTALGREAWDLVISDFLLPETNGLEILAALRKQDPDLPFILLSGVLDEGAAVEAMRNGANDFLLKAKLSRLVPAIEREIRESEVHRQRRVGEAELRLLHGAIGQTPDMVVITDPDGAIVYANPAAEVTSGFSREELLGQNPRLFKSDLHDAAFYKTMWDALLRGETWRGHVVNKRKDGSRWDSESVISPVYGQEGTLENYLCTARDVSHERELEILLEQSQRMETIGVLTSGIAHDFNNILMPVAARAELGLERSPGDPRIRKDLEVILSSAQRAADLVRQILTFSRKGTQEALPLELQSLLGESLKLLRATVPTPIAFKVQLEARNCWVAGDPTKLHQVILNLCVNATHAMRGAAGLLTVKLRPVHLEVTPCSMGVSLPAGDFLLLEVIDTGRGISPEHLDKIFLPFFTTKAPKEGTGLGLSVTHAIVSAMGGGILVESRPTEGSRFTVLLPAVPAPGASAPAPEETAVRGHARVLLVDDETTLLYALQGGLEHLGFQVTCFDHSEPALAAFRRSPGAFDIVLTDYQMPGMNGSQMAAEIRAVRPDLPTILLTGNSLLVDEGIPGLDRFRAVLYKPMLASEVAKVIMEALEPVP